ncbi:L-xylulose reductase [Acipenser ruthenus]|uniref:L-xylulose reductase n=1 Tax=Acipenser ruthenus TaxID=7906 RepID=A0A444UQJ3_ACIRT|nr:L-xylulose reductase [Acipenser ruthenus]
MHLSRVGISKLCFLLSLVFCAFLLLLIPGLQPPRRQGDLPQPLPQGKTGWVQGGSVNQQPLKPNVLQLIRAAAPGPDTEGGLDMKEWPVGLLQTVDKRSERAEVLGRNLSAYDPDKRDSSAYSRSTSRQGLPVKEPLKQEDIFIAVKTTRKYHKSRLDLLFQTWISRAKKETFIFTDGEDKELREKAGNQMINTNCSAAHTRQALCCKMSVEYDKFIESGKNLGNFISTAEKIRLPDDCTIGYIIEALLEVKMIHSRLFHSHLENLQRLPIDTVLSQVTLSYGGFESHRNVVSVGGAFSLVEDPSRQQTVNFALICLQLSECPSITPVCVDLADWDSTEKALQDMGPVDLLVNNAAVATLQPFLEVTPQEFDKSFSVNVKAALHVAQIIARGMKSRGSGGSIVNVSSQASQCALQDHAVYCATKGALDMLTKVMALELGPHKVRLDSITSPATCFCVVPIRGFMAMALGFMSIAFIQRRTIAKVEDVVNAILFLLSEKSAMITGATLPVDGGFLAC